MRRLEQEGVSILLGDGGAGFLLLVGAAFLFWFAIILPARMAEARGRSGFLWVLMSLVASPPLAILLLLALGNASDRSR